MNKRQKIVEAAKKNPSKKNVAKLVELCEALAHSNTKLRKKLAEANEVAMTACARWTNMEWEKETGRQ